MLYEHILDSVALDLNKFKKIIQKEIVSFFCLLLLERSHQNTLELNFSFVPNCHRLSNFSVAVLNMRKIG